MSAELPWVAFAIDVPIDAGPRRRATKAQVPVGAGAIRRRMCGRFRRRAIGAWCIAAALALPLHLTAADRISGPTQRDFYLIAQTLSFLREAPTGTLYLGIIYPAASQLGRAEAEQIQAEFGGGVSLGALTLRPRLLTVDEALKTPGLVAVLLTKAALPEAAAIAAAVAGKGVLTIASDPAPVAAGTVILAVRSTPRVEIYLSRSAAEAARVEFSTPFMLMIQER
jgi:hypothetical protein